MSSGIRIRARDEQRKRDWWNRPIAYRKAALGVHGILKNPIEIERLLPFIKGVSHAK